MAEKLEFFVIFYKEMSGSNRGAHFISIALMLSYHNHLVFFYLQDR